MSGTAASSGAFTAQVQAFVLVDPVYALVIIAKSFTPQQNKDSIESIPKPGLSDVPDPQSKSGITAFMRLVIERGGAQQHA